MKATRGPVKLREATVAGIFYPDDPVELESKIASLLSSAPSMSASAILSPHAGLEYSGDLAARAWKAAAERSIDTVLILSPIHRADEACICLPESDVFDTPLGAVPVDRGLVAELRDCGTLFDENDIPHFEEHGIEVQLPFMHMVFPEASLVPVLVGKPSQASIKALSRALDFVFGERREKLLVVLSSDLGSSSDDVEAARLADRFLSAIEASDTAAMLEDKATLPGYACGAGCVAAYLGSKLGEGASPVLLGRHDSSAVRESSEEKLVEYGAVAF
jgi:AmmeMemoRadiSam system protein B